MTGGLCTYFQKGEQHYYADRSLVFDYGVYETMIFTCNEQGEVTDWTEVYCDRTGKSLAACVNEFLAS